MADAGVGEKLKVFISYSRKDEGFAQELAAGLELTGFQRYMDKHDIATGEDWETRLGRLIEAAESASTHGATAEACAADFGSDCYVGRHRLVRAGANRRCLLAVQSPISRSKHL
jgi:hypothetical protein